MLCRHLIKTCYRAILCRHLFKTGYIAILCRHLIKTCYRAVLCRHLIKTCYIAILCRHFNQNLLYGYSMQTFNQNLYLLQVCTGFDPDTDECNIFPDHCSCVETRTPDTYRLKYTITAETRLSGKTVRLVWPGESKPLFSHSFTLPEIKGRHESLMIISYFVTAGSRYIYCHFLRYNQLLFLDIKIDAQLDRWIKIYVCS